MPTGVAVALVAAGGAAGGVLRGAVRVALPHQPSSWPWATLLVNVLGAFALGGLLGLLARAPSERLRLLLGTGLLGAATTFSGVTVEAAQLLAGGRALTAVGYVGVSVVGLLAAAALGARLVRR